MSVEAVRKRGMVPRHFDPRFNFYRAFHRQQHFFNDERQAEDVGHLGVVVGTSLLALNIFQMLSLNNFKRRKKKQEKKQLTISGGPYNSVPTSVVIFALLTPDLSFGISKASPKSVSFMSSSLIVRSRFAGLMSR